MNIRLLKYDFKTIFFQQSYVTFLLNRCECTIIDPIRHSEFHGHDTDVSDTI